MLFANRGVFVFLRFLWIYRRFTSANNHPYLRHIHTMFWHQFASLIELSMRCFQRTEKHGGALCSSASISIPLATHTKSRVLCTYIIERFNLNVFSDREKLLCVCCRLSREISLRAKRIQITVDLAASIALSAFLHTHTHTYMSYRNMM